MDKKKLYRDIDEVNGNLRIAVCNLQDVGFYLYEYAERIRKIAKAKLKAAGSTPTVDDIKDYADTCEVAALVEHFRSQLNDLWLAIDGATVPTSCDEDEDEAND